VTTEPAALDQEDLHYIETVLEFTRHRDEWPGGFISGEKVTGGQFGDCVVASFDYCMGRAQCQRGKIVENTGLRHGLITVLYPKYGAWWVAPSQIRRRT
jgi:hypothetical protein